MDCRKTAFPGRLKARFIEAIIKFVISTPERFGVECSCVAGSGQLKPCAFALFAMRSEDDRGFEPRTGH